MEEEYHYNIMLKTLSKVETSINHANNYNYGTISNEYCMLLSTK